MSSDAGLLDPSIFEFLSKTLEEETQVRDTLTQIIQRLERAVATAQAQLSRVHSTPREKCMHSPNPSISHTLWERESHRGRCHANTSPDPALVSQVEATIQDQVAIFAELNEVASKHPYYK